MRPLNRNSRMNSWLLMLVLCLYSNGIFAQSKTYEILPGDNPQAILDNADEGSELVFLPGIHEHSLGRHQSILYVEKSVNIELQRGAVLKLADRETTLRSTPEITVDHGAPKQLNDLSAGGSYDKSAGQIYFAIYIDGEANGEEGADTFRWALDKRRSQLARRIPQSKNFNYRTVAKLK